MLSGEHHINTTAVWSRARKVPQEQLIIAYDPYVLHSLKCPALLFNSFFQFALVKSSSSSLNLSNHSSLSPHPAHLLIKLV
jgi:hypothetical protein